MPDKYCAGDVLYYDNGYGYHYHIVVISSQVESVTRHICVFLSTSSINPDLTISFVKNEDSFITKNCWVKYQSAYIETDEALSQKENLIYKGKVNQKTYEKLKRGFMISKRIPKWLKETFMSWLDDQSYSNL